MTYPIIVEVVPYAITGSGYQYTASDFTRLSDNPGEYWATAQWIFGNTSASLSDVTASLALTPNATVPTYTSAGMTTASGGYNGLKTPYNDSLTYTLAAVFKRELATANNQFVLGSMKNDGSGGSGIFAFPGGPSYNSVASGLNSNGGVAFTMPGTDGQYVFVAIVETPGQRLIYTGSGGTLTLAGTVTGTRNLNGAGKLSLGNVYYQVGATWQRGTTFAEATYSTQAQSSQVLTNYYQAIRARGTGADRSVVPI